MNKIKSNIYQKSSKFVKKSQEIFKNTRKQNLTVLFINYINILH